MFKILKKLKRKKVIVSLILVVLLLIAPYPLLYLTSYGDGFSCSFYNGTGFLNQTVMVIVPHEDDELGVAGAVMRNLVREDPNSRIIVVYTTNGDYVDTAQTRITEAIEAEKVIGVKPENIIFLGYGDQWNYVLGERDLSSTDNYHIYNSEGEEVVESFSGNIQTYGAFEHPDFRTMVSGQPSPYTRNNYKTDLKDVMLKYLPDVIFAVDFDDHPDHRATSLLFEEALGELLRENVGFEPIVYKGFAYNTGWKAVNDFYETNLKATMLPDKSDLNDPNFELDVPQYDWERRVRFPMPPEMLSYTIRSNMLYEALMEHKSQDIKLISERLINSDTVFWERRTDSLTYDSVVTVSSGEPSYVNDFKLYDCSDVLAEPAILDQCVWEPSQADSEKSVKIQLSGPATIGCVTLYDDFRLEDNILSGTLLFSDGSQVEVGPLNKNGSATIIEVPVVEGITEVTFRIKESEGSSPGLTEMELYESMDVREAQLIKIMVDDEADTFAYRYRCPKSGEIQLSTYIYPNTALNAYRLTLVEDAGGDAQLLNNVLTLKSSMLPKKCLVRAELIDHPEIYDEVEFVSYNWVDTLYYGGLQGYENALEKLSLLPGKIKYKIKSIVN